MLYRKIYAEIEQHLRSGNDKILIVQGARQIGKSYTIREVGRKVYKHFVEINFAEDSEGAKVFENVHTTDEFYLRLGMVAGGKLGKFENTLIFLDEIQQYPQFLTMLKFLRQEARYRYIASGSLLGVALRQTSSIPIGSITLRNMYQLDFEEWLIANGWGNEAIRHVRDCYFKKEALSEAFHNKLMQELKKYLIVGGLPDAVNAYLTTHNVAKVRDVHKTIHELYKQDAAKYEENANKRLLIRRIYDLIPSQMENKKKRIVAQKIRDKKGDRFNQYLEEFEYLISSGISLDVHAISNPRFPLAETEQKNLLKLYMNDVGLLTAQLYKNNLTPILDDELSINLGSVYESFVAQELKAHGSKLFYYDNRSKGEVDFLTDDFNTTSVVPIEVKSGKDYMVHSALDNLMKVPDYGIKSAIVLSNERKVFVDGDVAYMPIYYCMFACTDVVKDESEHIF